MNNNYEKQSFGNNGAWINRRLIVIIMVMVSIAAMVAALLVASHFDKKAGRVEVGSSAETIVKTNSTVRLEIPLFVNEQYLVGRGVIAYMESDLSEDVAKVLAEYRTSQPMDTGYPVVINFDITGIPYGYQITALRAEISENTAFDAPRVIPLQIDDRSVNVYYLKTGTQYYFRIIMTISNGSEIMAQGSFKTAATPRVLGIDGIVNVRDFGGWKTESGQTIRQGLLYRGSEPDGYTEGKYIITEKGKDAMVNVLGVKTQIDLRWDVQLDSFGDQVEHRRYAVSMYSKIFEEESQERLQLLFSDMANPDMYPAYIHCTYGWDRTGTVCAILGFLLGMSEEDVIREQELTALCHGGSNIEQFEEFIAELKKNEGNTMQQKVENYLLSIGVKQEEIDSIREIFLTD